MDKIQFKDTTPPRFYDVYFKEGKIARIHHYIGSPERTMFDKYGKVDVVISGYGWVSFEYTNQKIEVYVPKNCNVYVREALI